MADENAENAAPKTCFTIMPFTVRPDDLEHYNNDKDHWHEVYKGLIAPAVEKSGLKSERDDEDVSSRLITENIWRKIEEADIILCDLSAYNVNVYLEMGWALRADRRFVLIKDDLTEWSFDLQQYYTFEYKHLLQPTRLKSEINDLSKVIKNTLEDSEKKYSMVGKLSLQLRAIKATEGGDVYVGLMREILREVRALSKSRPQRVHRDVSLPKRQAAFGPAQTYWDAQLDEDDLIRSTWLRRGGTERIMLVSGQNFTYAENRFSLPVFAETGMYSLERGPGPKRYLNFVSDVYKDRWELLDDGNYVVGVGRVSVWELVKSK